MSKRCPHCGRFMRLTDELPRWHEDEFDDDLAIDCGFNEDEDSPFDEKWMRFAYVHDQWECGACDLLIPNEKGKRYYYNPDTNWYNGEKPLTPKEQIALENKAQEAAGQMRLFS